MCIRDRSLGRSPTGAEIAERVDISAERTRNALDVSQQDLSFDAPAYPGEADSLLSLHPAPQDGADDRVEEAEMRDRLSSCLSLLDERETEIVRAYFGLGGDEPRTLEEIGDSLGVTRERVRQLRNRALAKLRDNCGEVLGELSRN